MFHFQGNTKQVDVLLSSTSHYNLHIGVIINNYTNTEHEIWIKNCLDVCQHGIEFVLAFT